MKNHENSVDRAEELLAKMSLEEKMAQIVGYYPSAQWSEEELEKEYPQGAGQVACFGMREIDTLEQIAEYQRKLQDKIMALSEHRIPAIFHMEGLCGILVKEADGFPSGIGRGSTWNPELERKVGEIVGRQASAVGASHVLAPVIDISRDSRFGRQGETYGEDPVLASAMGVAYLEGLQMEKKEGMQIEGVAKHFLGYHDSQGGIHAANCDIPYRLLREVYAKPFQAAISKAGLKSVMPCYSSLNGEPVTGSKEVMNGLLREEMGFDGMVISDYCAVSEIHSRQNVCESVTEAGRRALEAGVDIELPSKVSYNEEMAQWFATGKMDEGVLDQAVKRILTAKFRMGLFENPYAASGKDLRNYFHKQENENVSLQAARESLVLLKNDGILPISKEVKKIAVIGYHAASTRSMFGGYTYMSMTERWLGARNTMAGIKEQEISSGYEEERLHGTFVQKEHPMAEKLAKKLKPGSSNLLEQLRRSLPDTEIIYAYGYPYAGDDTSGHDEALQKAKEADLVIVTVGGKYGTGSMASTGEGIDSTNVNLPPCQEIFLEKLATLHKPFVAVHFDGRPISSDNADRYANGILEAWSPAEKGAVAIAEALLGEYNPGGKLPVSAAYNAGQEPIYYNHTNGSSYHQGCIGAFTSYMDRPFEPRYSFGHGLSYTTFAYSDMKMDKKEVDPSDSVTVTIQVENTGNVAGDEVVQLYVKDVFASMTRPVMELAGFKRIHLAPGEKKNISFTILVSQLAFLDQEKRWKVEKGEINVMIGASSNDIKWKESFWIRSDLYIDERTRGFFAETEIK